MSDLEQERQLVEAVKQDLSRFNELYQLYFDKIYHFILSRCGQVELAEDITSQTFLNALEKINQFKWRNISFCAWLYRIAINNLNSHYRKNNRMVATEAETLISLADERQTPAEPYEELDEKLRLTELKKSLDKLSKDDQNLITLKYFQEKSYTEISEILKIPVNTVGVKLHRCLKKVSKIINLEYENQ